MRLVALLRAVNVAGTGKLPMAELRKRVESLGYANVETFIQTGNVLFDARSASGVVEKIESALKKRCGLDTSVMLRTPVELATLAAGHAFAGRADGARLHVAFLRDAQRKNATLDTSRSPGDEAIVRGREVHLFFPNGAGKSKITMASIERALGTVGTMRNLNTVTKLSELAAGG